MIRRHLVAEPYGGGNEVIDKFLQDDDVLWIVQGSFGRVPVLAETEEDAKTRYVEKFAERAEAEAEIAVTDEDE